MTNRLLSGVVMCGLAAGMAQGATVWNPAGNGIAPPATGDWADAANWTNGVPDAVEKAVFNVPDAAECIVTTAVSGMTIVQGDNGSGGTIRVALGGSISTASDTWSAVGYNDTAHMIVETGGTANFEHQLWIGFTATGIGTLDINGGTVNVLNNQFGLGWSGGVGSVNVYDGGALNLKQWSTDNSFGPGSVMNIVGSGFVTIQGNKEGDTDGLVALGSIVGNGIVGNVVRSYDGSVTTITAGPLIPEPSTLGLLGAFGAIGLLRRRRS